MAGLEYGVLVVVVAVVTVVVGCLVDGSHASGSLVRCRFLAAVL